MKHNWEHSGFNQIATTVTPNIKIDKSSYLATGLVPIISQEENIISGYWNNLSDITTHNKPVVIFGDHSRVIKYVDFEFVVGADGVKIIEPKDNLSTKFLYHFLKWYNVPALGYARHFKLVKEANYPVPPMEVQERIVAELDGINSQIDRCRQLLQILDSLATSLFYDTFGDPVTNPKGWEIVRLGDVSEKISNGANAKIELDTYKTEGVMFFRCQNVWKNRFDYSDIAYVDEDFNKQYKSSSLKHNDLIVTKIGRLFTENSSLGRVSLYEGDDDRANLSGNLSYIRLKNGVCPRFILYIMISDYFRDYVRNTTSGGIDKRALNNSQLKAFPIYLPPLSLQEMFATQVEAIEAQKKKVEATITELQTLLDSRMDYWFN
ncbi:MAG: restriction endonuclease subunit S [Muribaculum sp.]|nr:restriction endonuclease subunit S [Muribaculum sp.]